MNDKKLTDAEIVKALEDIIKHLDFTQIKSGENVLANALDLINRLQAEIKHLDDESDALRADIDFRDKVISELQAENERLQDAIDEQDIDISRLYKKIDETISEAYKELASLFTSRLVNMNPVYALGYRLAILHIDNLLKELVGEDK